MYIFVLYGSVGPSWNEKRIAQAIVGHICFVDVQGTPGHRCVCLVCAYYVAVCPLAAAAMAANDREWLCNIYPPTRTQLASYSHLEGISKLTTTTSLYSKSQWTRSSRNISGHIEYALAAQAYLGLHSNVIRMRWARLRVLILSVCVIPQFL